MKTKTILIIALAAMAVLYAINLITESSNTTYENNFAVADTSSVVQIFMVDKKNNQIDLKKQNGRWVLNDNDHPIQENVDIILKTLYKMEIQSPASKASFNFKVKQLATNSTKVEVYQNQYHVNIWGIKLFPFVDKTRVFYVGGPTANNQGTLMKSEDEDEIYIVYIPGFRGYLTERFSAKYADWISHEIFAYNIMDMKKVSIEFPRQSHNSYEIINQGDRSFKLIQLQSNQEVAAFDTLRVLEELAAFSRINYESLLDNMTDQQIDSLRKVFPVRIVTVETKLGTKRTLKMYYRPNFDNREGIDGKVFDHDMNRLYAFIDDQKHPVTVQYFVIDNISRPLSYILQTQKTVAKSAEKSE